MAHSGNILVVDNTPANLEVIVETLSLAGYTVWAVTSGKRALKQLQTHIPDLILLDIQMPEMDGFTTCKMIKSNADTAAIPIIFITSFSDTDSIVKGFSLGAVDYINKPFRELELLARVQTHLNIQVLTQCLKEQAQQAEIAKQEAERAKQNADRANQAKSDFLATMSHELRTPLNAILGLTEGLQDGILGELASDQINAIATIEQSGNHLLSLINDILDLAKIDAGKLTIEPVPTRFMEVCTDCLNFIQPIAESKNIQLASDITPYETPINTDPRRLNQILINLLSNAVKFTPSGGQVKFKAEVHEPSSMLEFQVIDTGVGIAPSDLPKLFQAFVQLDSHLNRQYEGTGLGLALVKRLVETQNGHIDVESTLNQGSCFRVRLPYQVIEPQSIVSQPTVSRSVPSYQQTQALKTRASVSLSSSASPLFPSPAPTSKSRAQPPLSTQGFLILLAEDHQSNIDILTSYLTHYKHRIVVAKDGVEAIALAREHHPDVILMDIHMPAMDGIEAIRHIRTMPDIGAIPIIALTALAMPGDKERCLEIGADRYLSKPVKLKQLGNMIEDLVQEKGVIQKTKGHQSIPVSTNGFTP